MRATLALGLIIFLEDDQAFSSCEGDHGSNVKLVENKKLLRDDQKIVDELNK